MIPFLFTLGFPVDSNLLNIKPQFDKFLIFVEMVPWFCPIQLVSVFCFNQQVTYNVFWKLSKLPMCVSCRTACSPLEVAF